MTQASMTWQEALIEAGCYGFLEHVAAQAVDEALGRCIEVAPLVGEGAHSDLKALCLSRLATIYERPLVKLALRRVAPSVPFSLGGRGQVQASEMRHAAEGVRDEVAWDGGAQLRESLAFAPAYEEAMLRNFVDATSELLVRLLRCRDVLSATLLEGRPLTRVEGIAAQGADPHRHGRMVMRVDTDAGSFFYKPHDCHLDALYLELASALFGDCARAATLVQGDGYAFVERLVPQEPAGMEGLCAYWRNLGCLAALFHGLGSRDMTCDNLMCCGEHPAVLDLETLLVGEMSFAGDGLARDAVVRDLSAKQLADSLACTAILPLHAGGVMASPLVADNASGTCLPRVDGKAMAVQGHAGAFAEGFEEGYRRLMRHRGEMLEVLGLHGEALCRQILLNTGAYGRARSLLFSPQAMSDPSKRDKVLAELNRAYGVFSEELRHAVAEPDAAALMEGDIPYYCAKASSRMLVSGDGRPLGELLAHSPLEVAVTRLSRFSEDELRFELDLIERCLAATLANGDRS